MNFTRYDLYNHTSVNYNRDNSSEFAVLGIFLVIIFGIMVLTIRGDVKRSNQIDTISEENLMNSRYRNNRNIRNLESRRRTNNIQLRPRNRRHIYNFIFGLRSQPNSTRNIINYKFDNRIYNIKIITSNSDNEICVICQDNLVKNSKIVILECKHKYHKKCFEKLNSFDRNFRCPICRSEII